MKRMKEIYFLVMIKFYFSLFSSHYLKFFVLFLFFTYFSTSNQIQKFHENERIWRENYNKNKEYEIKYIGGKKLKKKHKYTMNYKISTCWLFWDFLLWLLRCGSWWELLLLLLFLRTLVIVELMSTNSLSH